MAKTKVNLYQLIEKYLLSIGIPKSIISLQIIPNKFENVIYSVSQRQSNIVTANKKNTSSKETHIAVAKKCWYMFFSDTDVAAYEVDGVTREKQQSFSFFEANIYEMLERRSKSVGKNSLLKAATPKQTYSASTNIILGAGCTWIDSNDGITQVRLSKARKDSDSFLDFRLGIQINDLVILLKERFNNNILAIAIPREFANKYDISEKIKISVKEKHQAEKVEKIADIEPFFVFRTPFRECSFKLNKFA